MTLLQHLSLEGCWKITNDGIRTLAQTCRGLRTIKLSGCYKLSDNALKYLADNCQSARCSLRMRVCLGSALKQRLFARRHGKVEIGSAPRNLGQGPQVHRRSQRIEPPYS
jgi:hypothetical protein